MDGLVFAVVCSSPDPECDHFEHMVVLRDGVANVVAIPCTITMDKYPPS